MPIKNDNTARKSVEQKNKNKKKQKHEHSKQLGLHSCFNNIDFLQTLKSQKVFSWRP